MKRRLMQFLFGVGLLFTLALAMVFVRGFWAADSWTVWRLRTDGADFLQTHFSVHTSGWRCGFAWDYMREAGAAPVYGDFAPGGFTFEHGSFPGSPPRLYGSGAPEFEGYADHDADGNVLAHRSASAPTWLLLLTCAAVTALPARRLLRDSARRTAATHGLCPACGYDLRGADHERCPECGAGVEVARV